MASSNTLRARCYEHCDALGCWAMSVIDVVNTIVAIRKSLWCILVSFIQNPVEISELRRD